MQFLGGLTPEVFLREYWQKKPLLIKNAIPQFRSPVRPADLKRLAQQDDVMARLILEEGGEYPWELRDGPFTARELATLPKTKWALLVQEVDKHHEGAKALLEPLNFIPQWRIDDVMISLAPADSGVGAHIDHYDVFLLQGLGKRRWRIGDAPVPPGEDEVYEDRDVSVLRDFRWTHEYILEPGDILYLPPRVAHEGTALDECITISLGFRAPSQREVVAEFAEFLAPRVPEHVFYSDPDLTPTAAPGLVDETSLSRLRSLLLDALQDEDAFRSWALSSLTSARRVVFEDEWDDDEAEPLEEDALVDAVREGASLERVAGLRIAYSVLPNGYTVLGVGGRTYRLEPALAFAGPLLAHHTTLTAEQVRPYLDVPDFPALLATLVSEGALAL